MRRMSLIAVTGCRRRRPHALRLRLGLPVHLAGRRQHRQPVRPPAAVASTRPSRPRSRPSIKSAGKIVVGTDPTYAPNEMLAADGKTVEGFDVDVFNAVAAKLGLKTEYVPAGFGTIILGVTGGKYDIGVSSFTINPERKKQVNMVSYYSAGTQWVVAKGNPEKVNIDDACGKSVGAQKDTVQAEDLAARSKKCTDAGKPGDQRRSSRTGQDQVTADVASGKTVAMLADSPVGLYAVKQTGHARGARRHLRLGPLRLRRAEGPDRLRQPPRRGPQGDQGRRQLRGGPQEVLRRGRRASTTSPSTRERPSDRHQHRRPAGRHRRPAGPPPRPMGRARRHPRAHRR